MHGVQEILENASYLLTVFIFLGIIKLYTDKIINRKKEIDMYS